MGWPSARTPRDWISRVEPLNWRKGGAAVPGCGFGRRLAASSSTGRDARPTRRRDACATRSMGRTFRPGGTRFGLDLASTVETGGCFKGQASPAPSARCLFLYSQTPGRPENTRFCLFRTLLTIKRLFPTIFRFRRMVLRNFRMILWTRRMVLRTFRMIIWPRRIIPRTRRMVLRPLKIILRTLTIILRFQRIIPRTRRMV
jgi:hypothetical protein